MRTPRSSSLARSPSASRAGCTVAFSRKRAPPRKSGESQRARTSSPPIASTSSGAPSSRAARTISDQEPICDVVVATRSIGAARYQASTSCFSHQAPIPRTASSDARQTASAASSPARSRRVAASGHSVSQKPPFLPLGPCPQTLGFEHEHVERSARARGAATRSRAPGTRRRRRPRLRVCPRRADGSA